LTGGRVVDGERRLTQTTRQVAAALFPLLAASTIGIVTIPPSTVRPSVNRCATGLAGALVIALLVATVVFGFEAFGNSKAASLAWSTFQRDVATHQVRSASIDRSTGTITGSLRDGASYQTIGPIVLKPGQITLLKNAIANYKATVPIFRWAFILILLSIILAKRLIWLRARSRAIGLP